MKKSRGLPLDKCERTQEVKKVQGAPGDDLDEGGRHKTGLAAHSGQVPNDDDDDDDDDIYIMMQCVSVCLSRKIITFHFRGERRRRKVSGPLGLAGRGPALA